MSENTEPRATLLLVEDTADIRTMLRMRLEKTGYRVVEAGNAQEALEIATSNSPDLILMDIELPEIDGISATYTLREYRQLRHVPIVAITAYDGQDYRTDALDAGCDAYLTKPIDFGKLGALIEGLLQKSSRRGERTGERH